MDEYAGQPYIQELGYEGGANLLTTKEVKGCHPADS